MKRLLCAVLLSLSVISANAQTILDIQLSGLSESQPLQSYLPQLEKSFPVKFFYQEEWIAPFSVDKSFNGTRLEDALNSFFNGTDITFTVVNNYAVIILKDPSRLIEREKLLTTAALERKEIESRVVGDIKKYQPGKKVKISGLVKDDLLGQPQVGVTIIVNGKDGLTTNAEGRYEIVVDGGENVLRFLHLNFKEKVIDLTAYQSGVLDVQMEEAPTVLEEVVFSDQALTNRRVGQTTIRMVDLKRSPTFLGEVDVIKQIQTQPGVTTVGEIASGFNVRGGGVDQNLVLYDGIPIFNTSHALGFFSSFNSNVIDRVSFYRGGIPAEYGGRASSVLDVVSKEGPMDKWTASGGIGIISTHLSVGGPIKRDTTSIEASVRTSYSDWVLNTVKSDYEDLSSASVNFYDASLKLVHKFNTNTKITFSGYASSDKFSLINDTVYVSQNLGASVRLDRSFNSKLSSSLSLGFGKYAYTVKEEDPESAADLNYSISYPFLKLDFSYEGTHKLSWGLENIFYDFAPGDLKPTSPESDAASVAMPHEKAMETAVYIGDEFTWRENVLIEAGLRTSLYNRIGPGTVYYYNTTGPREPQNVQDSTSFESGEIMKTYLGLEPRLSARLTLDAHSSLKFGYNRMFQYLHLISNTAAVTPIDIWQSSNNYFKPQIVDQISLGYYRNLKDNMYEGFVEVFYKKMQNVLDFKDGAMLILNKHLETDLLSGKGTAYGAEFSFNKIKGRLTGSINYTYSRSWRTVDGAYDEEKINEGTKYAANYDQPHVLVMNWRYGILRRFFFSGGFTYHTGRPMSVPLSGYQVDGVPVLNFSDRNMYRIPDYHRLDVAFILEGGHKRKKILDGTWAVSFYNVYAHKNAYSVFFADDGTGTLKPYKLSVIGTMIPSVSYSFKF